MKKKLLFSAFIFVLPLLVIKFFAYLYNHRLNSNKILPRIYIDNIAVGGLEKEQAVNLLNKFYQDKAKFSLVLELEDKLISKLSAKNFDYQLPITNVVDQAYLIGRTKNISAVYQNLSLNLGWESYYFDLNPNYNQQYLSSFLKELNSAYLVKPKEARFEFKDNKVSAFQLNEPGYELEIEKALLAIDKRLMLARRKPKKTIKITITKKTLEPGIKLKNINNLGIVEQVAEGHSQFLGSAPERVHNIVTSASKLNGLIIKPGETFSFNQALGEITASTGFQQAYVIQNGRTVLGDGGGICQVSTTLFRTALNAGLPIIERNAHAYRVGYYEQDADPGFDATIYSPSIDLRFKNNYQNALLIQTFVDQTNYTLSFIFYGSKDTRRVDISKATVWNVVPAPPPEYIDDFSLPEGVVKQVDFAASGASALFTYKVIDSDGSIYEKEFVSHFRPWKAIYLVGKKTD